MTCFANNLQLSSLVVYEAKYMILSMMIYGPRQPGNDIDIYLNPLIEGLTKLWDEGVAMYDGYRKETSKLCAMLFCFKKFMVFKIYL